LQCICYGCRTISVIGGCCAGNYCELKSFSTEVGSLVGVGSLVDVGSLVEVGSFVGGSGCGGGSVDLLFGIRFLPLDLR
jgi:hypothetical protein